MLRNKIYNKVKHSGLNYMFDLYIDDGLVSINENRPRVSKIFNVSNVRKKKLKIDNDNLMSNTIIKENDKYCLIKEIKLGVYFLVLKDILLIHIKGDLIKDFEFLYNKSNKYVFDIYETSYPDLKGTSIIKMYHVFCVSRKKMIKDVNYNAFLNANDSDSKYAYLTRLYGPCLIVNRRFDIRFACDKYNATYKYVKTIGNGDIDSSVRYFIKKMIDMSNEYQRVLPVNYLKIN